MRAGPSPKALPNKPLSPGIAHFAGLERSPLSRLRAVAIFQRSARRRANAERGESLECRNDRGAPIRGGQANAAAGVLDDRHLVAQPHRILGRPRDAEIGREPARNRRRKPRWRSQPSRPVAVRRSFSKNAE